MFGQKSISKRKARIRATRKGRQHKKLSRLVHHGPSLAVRFLMILCILLVFCTALLLAAVTTGL